MGFAKTLYPSYKAALFRPRTMINTAAATCNAMQT
jgi:hypothetical protein